MISSIGIIVLKKDWQDLAASLWGEKPNLATREPCTRSPPSTDFTGRASMGIAPRKSYYSWCSVTEYLSHYIVNQAVYWSPEGRTKVRRLLILSHCAPLICKYGWFQSPGPSEPPGWRIHRTFLAAKGHSVKKGEFCTVSGCLSSCGCFFLTVAKAHLIV